VWLPGSLRSSNSLPYLVAIAGPFPELTRNRFSRGVFSSVWRLETRFWRPKSHSQGGAGNIKWNISGTRAALAGGILFRRAVKISILSGNLGLVLWVKHACNMSASRQQAGICCSWKRLKRPQVVTRIGGADNFHRAKLRQKSVCLGRGGAQASRSLAQDVAERL